MRFVVRKWRKLEPNVSPSVGSFRGFPFRQPPRISGGNFDYGKIELGHISKIGSNDTTICKMHVETVQALIKNKRR